MESELVLYQLASLEVTSIRDWNDIKKEHSGNSMIFQIKTNVEL